MLHEPQEEIRQELLPATVTVNYIKANCCKLKINKLVSYAVCQKLIAKEILQIVRRT